MIRLCQPRSGTAPAILPVVQRSGKGHFVALLESRGEQVLLLDFPYPPKWVRSGGLRQAVGWDGTALHVARDPLQLLWLRLSAFSWFRISLVLSATAGAGFCAVRFAMSRRASPRVRASIGGRVRGGFTLIELIVVMAVIGVLVAIITPAIQRAREASRRTQCQNNLRQIGIAITAHEASRGQFPTLSVPRSKPAPPTTPPTPPLVTSGLSILYQVLPYLDQAPLFGRVDTNDDTRGATDEPPKSSTNEPVLTISVPVFMCPSDRWFTGSASYRTCAGTSPGMFTTPGTPLPNSSRGGFATGAMVRRAAEIRDGLSNTVFFSEKLVGDQDPSRYSAARDTILEVPGTFMLPDDAARGCRLPLSASDLNASFGGASWLFSGYGHTCYNHILTPNSRVPDCTTMSAVDANAAGAHTARSLHAGGVHVLMGDGATRFVGEEIDLGVWRAVGTIDSGDVSRDF